MSGSVLFLTPFKATEEMQGRKNQFCYHPIGREVRDQNKYDPLEAVRAGTVKVRRQVAEGFSPCLVTRRKFMAAIVSCWKRLLSEFGQ